MSQKVIKQYMKEKLDFFNQKSTSFILENFSFNEKVIINGKKYLLSGWVENYDDGYLCVIQIDGNKFFFISFYHTLGLFIKGEDRKFLSEEEMWDIGL